MSYKVFFHWAREKYLQDNSPKGDFVNDMIFDKTFPWMHSSTEKALDEYEQKVLIYLAHKNACKEAIDVFKLMFSEYRKSRNHSYSKRKEYYKHWRKEHPEKIREYNARYWGNQTSDGGELT